LSKPEKQNTNDLDYNLSVKKQWLFRSVLIFTPITLWIIIELILSLFIVEEKPLRRVKTNHNEAYIINQSYFDQFYLYKLPEMNNLPVTNNWRYE